MSISVGKINTTSITADCITAEPVAWNHIYGSVMTVNNPYNLYETINGYGAEIPIPGVTADEVKVFYEGNELRVVVHPKNDDSYEGMKFIRAGFSKRDMEYKIELPHCESVDAEVKNGVLYINASKKMKGVEVAIKTA